jgi:hypothetical protein
MESPVIASVQVRKATSSLPQLPPRRGWLRHGNRPGDYAKAPRCGARTRAGGCCRQPAMANGRCRMHGGRSTGPRTSEGLARSRRARWQHGFCSTEHRALRRDMAQLCRDMAVTLRMARAEIRRRRAAAAQRQPTTRRRPSSGAGSAASLGMGFIERNGAHARLSSENARVGATGGRPFCRGWDVDKGDRRSPLQDSASPREHPFAGRGAPPRAASLGMGFIERISISPPAPLDVVGASGARPGYDVPATGDRRSPLRFADDGPPIPDRCSGTAASCPS